MTLKIITDKSNMNSAVENCDEILEKAKGNYQDVLVLGYDKDGYADYRCNDTLNRKSDLNWLIDTFKKNLLRE